MAASRECRHHFSQHCDILTALARVYKNKFCRNKMLFFLFYSQVGRWPPPAPAPGGSARRSGRHNNKISQQRSPVITGHRVARSWEAIFNSTSTSLTVSRFKILKHPMENMAPLKKWLPCPCLATLFAYRWQRESKPCPHHCSGGVPFPGDGDLNLNRQQRPLVCHGPPGRHGGTAVSVCDGGDDGG